MTRRGSRPDAARLERSARFWMRAYPRRWRVARGEEVLGVLLDLAAPGVRRVGARAAFDLLRGGWATRWRGHPPLPLWIDYRFLDRSLSERYRGWAADDLESPFGVARNPVAVVALLVVFAPSGQAHQDPSFVASVLFVSVLASLSFWPARRVRLMELHVLPRPGERLYPAQIVAQAAPRRRVAALATLPWLLGALVALLAAAAVAVLAAPSGYQSRGSFLELWVVTGPVQDLVAAEPGVFWMGILLSAAGAVLAVVPARRRLAQAGARLAVQPARTVRGLGRLGTARLAAWTSACLALVVLEAVGAIALSISLTLLALGPFALAVGILLLRTARRLPDPERVALVDLWWLLWHRGPVPVDEPGVRFVPLPGPVPDGLVVPPPVLGGPRYPVLPV